MEKGEACEDMPKDSHMLASCALQPVVTHTPKANILFDLAHGNASTRFHSSMACKEHQYGVRLDDVNFLQV